MECVIGMSKYCMTDANIKKARDVYKATEIILTSDDFEPHGDVAALIHKYGMKAGYDLEYAWWAEPGFNIGYIPPNADAKLDAIKNAGWDYSTSEGLGGMQVAKIKEHIDYVNMGGESGEDVYADVTMYHRPRSMANGNYLECYHSYAIDAMKNAFASANLSTPNNMGMTFMKYTQTADLEVNVSAMLNLMKELINSGIKLKKMHFWGGIEAACVLDTLDGPLNPLYKGLENTWGFSNANTPAKHTPHIWCGMVDQPNYYKTNVQLGGNVVTSGRQGWLDTTTSDWAKPESLTADEKAALISPVALGARDANGNNIGIATVTPKDDGLFSATIASPSNARLMYYNWKGIAGNFGVEMAINWTAPLPPPQGGPIVNLTAQYTIDHDNGVDYIRGAARDKDGKPSTGRMTGLWKQDESTGNWNGVAWVAVDDAAYYEYNLTKLLPKAYHVLRLQTDDGPLINLTPYQRW